MRNKWISYPYTIWIALFIVIPLILVLYYSCILELNGKIIFTFEHIARIFEPIYLKVIFHTIWLAFIATVICFLIGYPISYILAQKEYKNRSILIFFFIVPMWMNFLLRTYAWLTLLEKNGVINNILVFLHLPKIDILYTEQAVALGMVYNFLPFMILPIHSVLKKIDYSLVEAAQDLGANSFTVFLKVIFPLSMPGIVSGITMVFMPAVTTFVISNLLGGGQFILIGNLIERQFLHVGDWNFGSAISLVLMFAILVTSTIASKFDKGSEKEGGSLF